MTDYDSTLLLSSHSNKLENSILDGALIVCVCVCEPECVCVSLEFMRLHSRH